MDRLLWWGLRTGARFLLLAALLTGMRYLAEGNPAYLAPALAGLILALGLLAIVSAAGVPEEARGRPDEAAR